MKDRDELAWDAAERVRKFLDRRVAMHGPDPETLFSLDGGRYVLDYHDLRVLTAFALQEPLPEETCRSVTGETEVPEDSPGVVNS